MFCISDKCLMTLFMWHAAFHVSHGVDMPDVIPLYGQNYYWPLDGQLAIYMSFD